MAYQLAIPALINIGRWVGTKAVPKIVSGVGNLLGRKMSYGGATAIAAAPAIGAYIDGKLGHTLSETVTKLPFGEAIETVLSLNEWANDEKAAVPSNLITNALEEKQIINENDPDYDQSLKMIDAIGHIAIGDTIGAGVTASELGIEVSDIADSINQAKRDNPEATLGQIGIIAFTDLREQQRANANDKVANDPIPEITDTASETSLGGVARIQSLQGSELSSEFNAVVQEENLNIFSSVEMFLAKALDFVGLDKLSDHFKRAIVIDSMVSEFTEVAGSTLETVAATPKPQLAVALNIK